MSNDIKINKKTVFIVGAVLFIAIFGVVAGLALNSSSARGNDNAGTSAATDSGHVQEVKLSYDWQKYEYVMDPGTLQKGVKARVTVDLNSVTGCMRDLRIDQFGVKKLVSQGNNVFEFTPDQAGTFAIHCSMYMGQGEFKVADSTGNVGNFKEQVSPTGASCGGAGGGCGCGGARNAAAT